MNTKNPYVLLFAASFFLAAEIYSQEEKGISLPTEDEVGRVYLASLVVDYMGGKPRTIVIYPKMIVNLDGKTEVLGTTAAVFVGDAAWEFIEFLAHPTKIRTSETDCDHVFFSSERGETQKFLSGEIRLYKEEAVRVRLHLESQIYPKIDFYYEGTGFKKWIMEHSTTLKVEKRE